MLGLHAWGAVTILRSIPKVFSEDVQDTQDLPIQP